MLPYNASHRRKVAVSDLKPGMYVVELDRPWGDVPFEEPFEMQGFTITGPKEISRVREFCEFVYIDPTLGLGAEHYLDDDELESLRPSYEQLFGGDMPEPIYQDQLTVEEEIARSRQIIEDSRLVYENVIRDLKAGKNIDTGAVKKSVGSLVESIIRNPDAASLLMQLKQKDSYTYTHAMSVCVTGLALGRYVGMPEPDLNSLGTALMLQDIGKIHIPDGILMKTVRLSGREIQLLKLHVNASVQMLNGKSTLDEDVMEIILRHHERYDGSGYPKGIKGDEVPLPAAIAGLVDTYVAMTFDRPYRPSKMSFEVLMWLYNQRSKKFPSALVEHFIRCIGIFPVGSFVLLDTGEVGVVISRNNVAQLKPRVMLVVDAAGNRLPEPETVDLAKPRSDSSSLPWKITRVVKAEAYDLDPDEFFV